MRERVKLQTLAVYEKPHICIILDLRAYVLVRKTQKDTPDVNTTDLSGWGGAKGIVYFVFIHVCLFGLYNKRESLKGTTHNMF